MVRLLIESLYRIDIVHGRKILRAVRWELPATLEDDLHDVRGRRIARHGFMGRAEARQAYTFVDPDKVRARLDELIAAADAPQIDTVRPFWPESTRTGLALHDWPRASLLGRAVAACPAPVQLRLELAFTRLSYRIQAARAPGAADVDELPRWTRHALSTCDMGLRHLCDDDMDRATTALTHLPVIELFSAGHGLVVRLHHAARRLRHELGGKDGLELLDGHAANVVRALLRGLPEFALPTSGPFEDPNAERSRPFESLDEIAQIRAELGRLHAAVGLVTRIAGTNPAALVAALAPRLVGGTADGVRLSSLVGTAVAQGLLGARPTLEPLAVADVQRLLKTMFEGVGGRRKVRASVRKGLSRALLSSPDLSDEAVARWGPCGETALSRLDDVLGGLSPTAPVDPRFVGTAVLLTA